MLRPEEGEGEPDLNDGTAQGGQQIQPSSGSTNGDNPSSPWHLF